MTVRTALVWLGAALATLSGCLFLMTLIWPEWMEAVFGLDPDRGDGSLELTIAILLLGFAITVSLCARREWRIEKRVGRLDVTAARGRNH